MSWAHAIRYATPDELHCVWRNSPYECSAPKCHAPAVYKVGYRYVTGRQGRVTSATRLICERHGEIFCKRYQLELPAPMGEGEI